MSDKDLINLSLDKISELQSEDQARALRVALTGAFSQGLIEWLRHEMKQRGASSFDLFWGPSNLMRLYQEDLDEADENTRKIVERNGFALDTIKAVIQEVLVEVAKQLGAQTVKEVLLMHYAKELAPALMETDLEEQLDDYGPEDEEGRQRAVEGFVKFDADIESGVLNEARATAAHFSIDPDEFLERIYTFARALGEDMQKEESKDEGEMELGEEPDLDVGDLFSEGIGDDEVGRLIMPSEFKRRRR